ncbi:hypothetical protein ABZ901_23475 [Actinacidiphila alni]|uniref:hypothetical protein n=1 Tax=Actinacidiphila alni TaxID=380248 RepID=UPI0033CECC6D
MAPGVATVRPAVRKRQRLRLRLRQPEQQRERRVDKRRRTAATGLTAALGCLCGVALLTGCVGEGAAAESGGPPAITGQDAARAVRAAADVLVRSGSSHVETAMRMASGGTWLTITGSGGFDYVKRQGELRLQLPKDAAGAEEHKPLTELLTPGALYMKNRGEGVPAGKWVRVDTDRLPDGNLVTGGATEPLAAAELLRGAQDVELVGTETRRGTRLRHYRGTADIARAADAAPPGDRGPLKAAAKGFSVTSVPFDAWLDADGRLRELSQRFTFSSDAPAADRAATTSGTKKPDASTEPAAKAKPAAPDVTVVSTTRYDTFGVAVPVTMPRAADIWTGKIVSS